MSKDGRGGLGRGSGCARREEDHGSNNGGKGDEGRNCGDVEEPTEGDCDTQPGKVAERAKEASSDCVEVLIGGNKRAGIKASNERSSSGGDNGCVIGNGGDHVMSESSSNGIGDGGHHSTQWKA